jgi:hypothetical protein
MSEENKVRSWLDVGGRSDHMPNLLHMEKHDQKESIPFNFNHV